MDLMERLVEAKAFVESRGYTCAYAAIYGSQNYGLALDTADYRSDVDVKCAVLPSLSELAREEPVPPATLEWQDGQIEVKDARRFTQVAMRLNPAYLETLLTPHYLAPCAAFEEIRSMVPALLESDPAGFLQACRGMGLMKLKNLSHPFPAALEKVLRWGYDGKQAHHLYRLLLIMRCFEKTGSYELAAPLEEYDFLIALKRNELPLERALVLAKEWVQEMKEICERAGEKGHGTAALEKRARQSVCRAIEEHIRLSCQMEYGK